VRRGDSLLDINGRPPLDILDYLEASEESRINLRLQREGREFSCKLRKEMGEPLGLVFDEAVFDGIRTCRNSCIFCYVDQLPRGLRPSLYIKDDDYRLSFYYGNFITLNNLSRSDLERILRLRLSPLYVSLHSTDVSLRNYLMGGGAERGLEALKIILGEGLQVHLQVVVCPGINDGDALRRTMGDVLKEYPATSLALVPLGLTSRAPGLSAELRPHDGKSAQSILEMLKDFQGRALERKGRRLFYAADELYLIAGEELPRGEEYDGYPQLDNGVGMARKFIDETQSAAAAGVTSAIGRGVITARAGETVIKKALEGIPLWEELEIIVLRNRVLGDSVTVSALLTGEDIIEGMSSQEVYSRELLLPDSMLRDGYFLDNKSIADVERETGRALIPVEVNGSAFIRALYEKAKGEGG
jgi:putative radical SAM enzyme (TIGR03279 family)